MGANVNACCSIISSVNSTSSPRTTAPVRNNVRLQLRGAACRAGLSPLTQSARVSDAISHRHDAPHWLKPLPPLSAPLPPARDPLDRNSLWSAHACRRPFIGTGLAHRKAQRGHGQARSGCRRAPAAAAAEQVSPAPPQYWTAPLSTAVQADAAKVAEKPEPRFNWFDQVHTSPHLATTLHLFALVCCCQQAPLSVCVSLSCSALDSVVHQLAVDGCPPLPATPRCSGIPLLTSRTSQPTHPMPSLCWKHPCEAASHPTRRSCLAITWRISSASRPCPGLLGLARVSFASDLEIPKLHLVSILFLRPLTASQPLPAHAAV